MDPISREIFSKVRFKAKKRTLFMGNLSNVVFQTCFDVLEMI